MQLSSYISDLLYRYECVIVPDFGGFVSNTIPSQVNHFTHTFYPPTKKLTFNSQLKNNDGLLANYIAVVENCSFEEANEKISSLVTTWKNQLQNDTLTLAKIGKLSLNKEEKLIFEPLETVNYLTSSFGLENYSSPAIKRETYKQKAVVLQPAATKKKSAGFFKYAAAAAILLTLGTLGYNEIEKNTIASIEIENQEKLTKKIQQSTFLIGELPEITLDVVKKELPKKYHLIAGAFGEEANAYKKVAQLKRKGFNAEILGKNKWGLTQVTFDSYTTREEAVKNLKIIKRKVAKDAWLFIK